MKILIICLLFLVGFNAYASEKLSKCDEYYDVGHAIMNMRQNGMPITKIMNRIGESPESKNPIVEMVKLAYNSPVFETKEAKEKAAVEFGNQMYLICSKL